MKSVLILLVAFAAGSNALAENSANSQVVCRESTGSTYRLDQGDPLTIACGSAQNKINDYLADTRFKSVSAPIMNSKSQTASAGINTSYSISENRAYCQICVTVENGAVEENKNLAELWCRNSWYELDNRSDQSPRSLSCYKAQDRLNNALGSEKFSSISSFGSTTTTWKTGYEKGASCQVCSVVLK